MLANPPVSNPSFNTRTSTIGIGRQPKRPTTRDSESEPLWIPMLQSASKGKDLAEKQLIVLGGSPDQQRGFLEHLNPESVRQRNVNRGRGPGRHDRNVPVSNKYALGYTYHDVLDADQEDTLARLNVHMLANPSGRFAPLLKPLLTSKTVRDTLVVILLDWSDPFKWARQLRQWVRLLRKVIVSLDEETKVELEECMNLWKEKRVGPDVTTSNQDQSTVSLGPGEWDEGLGIPMAVVCVQSEKIERLERDLNWQDDQFDFLQQWLRTVLLKHGAALAYTANFDANNVRTLIHSTLGIQSLLKKEVVKHNMIDRDKIMVPPNWDSWGKIRILREGFDPETVSDAWSVEIQDQPEEAPDFAPQKQNDIQAILDASQQPISAVSIFESTLSNPIENPVTDRLTSTEITVVATPLQDFLQTQHGILEHYLVEDKEAAKQAVTKPGYLNNPLPTIDGNEKDLDPISARSASPMKGSLTLNSRMTDQIGPYQINVNGIDFDAEEATRRLRERENERNRRETSGGSTPTSARPRLTAMGSEGPGTPGADGREKHSNEALHGFFANLIKKGQGGSSRGGGGAGGSGANSPGPRRESPAPQMEKRSE